METRYQTIKIWKQTLKVLRLLAAMREQSIVKVLDDIVRKDFERVSSQE